MSLGIVFKSPEGIVLAADSRITLFNQLPGQNMLLPSPFDNATKLLKVVGQDFVGAVTYGLGSIGTLTFRTANSYLPDFEHELNKAGEKRLSVSDFSDKLSTFFMNRWNENMPAVYTGDAMIFLVGGIDEQSAHGRLFEFNIPYQPKPKEWHNLPGAFGAVYGGQQEYANRLIHGYDPRLIETLTTALSLTPDQQLTLKTSLEKFATPVPYQFLPLQDCIDLAIFIIRATIKMQSWILGLRGVGGAIDVATITRTKGFEYVQQKKIKGEPIYFEEEE